MVKHLVNFHALSARGTARKGEFKLPASECLPDPQVRACSEPGRVPHLTGCGWDMGHWQRDMVQARGQAAPAGTGQDSSFTVGTQTEPKGSVLQAKVKC